MIVELFGPPTAGKTTLAHALATALHKNGCDVQLIVSLRPAERPPHKAGSTTRIGRRAALAAPLSRAAKLISAIPALLPSTRDRDSDALLNLLPPRSLLWSIRYRRYLSLLYGSWKMAEASDGIVIVDQGFLTALCSLVLLTRPADRNLVARGLELIPKPDLVICLDAPRTILEARVRERLGHQGWLERLFEFDLETNLRQIEVAGELTAILQEQGRPVTYVNCRDQLPLECAVDRIMREIKANLGEEVREHPQSPMASTDDGRRANADMRLFSPRKAYAWTIGRASR